MICEVVLEGLSFAQAGEYFIENVLKGKGTEKRTKNLVADKHLDTGSSVQSS